MAEPFLKKPTEIEKQTARKIVENTLNKRTKPVKFTWKGASQLVGSFFDTNPFSKLKTERIKQLMEGDKAQEKDYIDFFEDIEKGLYGGVQDLGYGIGDLITSGIDAAAGTELTEALDEAYEKNKIKEPETLTGEVTKILTQYGVPGGAAFKVLNRVKTLSKARKVKKKSDKAINAAKRIGYMSTAFAATDFIASEPDRESVAIPLEKTEGLSGRDLALARIRNRVRYGAEGAAFGAGFTLLGKPAAFLFKYGLLKPGAKVAGLGLKVVDKGVVSPISYLAAKATPEPVGKALRNASNFVIDKSLSTAIAGNPKKQLPEFAKWRLFSVDSRDPVERKLRKLDNFLSYFRSLGKQTGLGYQITSDAKRAIKGDQRAVEKYLESIEKKAYDLAKSFEGQYNTATTSKASQDYYLDQVLSFLKGQTPKSALPKELQGTAQGLSNELLKAKTTFGKLLPEGDLKQYILKNLKSYMRRSFSIFTNPAYQPDTKVRTNAVNWVLNNVIKANKDLKESAVQTLKKPKMNNEDAFKEMAETTVDGILRAGKQDGVDPLNVIRRIAKKDLRLDTLVKTGDELPATIRKLLGEENNLRSSVLLTANNAITQSVNKMAMDKLAKIGVDEGWLFVDENIAKNKRFFDTQKIGDLKSLGLMKTNMSKLFASPELVQAFRGTNVGLDRWIQSGFYRNLLQLKVAAQYGKTVLSPVTQVRNVSSAGLFPLANGHIGGKASVTEAVKMVADDIFGAGKVIDEDKFINNLRRKIELGVIDENIVASELNAVLNEIKNTRGVTGIDKLIRRLSEGKYAYDDEFINKLGRGLSTLGKTATRVYAGGDNLWKWYGHSYVTAQLKPLFNTTDDVAKWYKEIVGREFLKRNTFGVNAGKLKSLDEATEEAAAWYIRNTYPTYSKVPQAIQDLRKLPFGNFVSFPAEMIRTTFNILTVGAKEATSANPKLRQMGYRRLLGAYTVLGGSSKAALGLASSLSGVTLEQLEAYKRSIAAPWDSRATILPINKWKDGVGKAINFSYFSPYDVVTQPIEALFKTIEEGKLKQQDVESTVFNLFFGDKGPVRTLLDPFLTQSIALERFTDVLPAELFVGNRGGVTKTGSKVYSPTDSGGEKVLKSLTHIIRGVEPGLVTTVDKTYQAAQADIKKGGTPTNLQDELLALFSGIRIINVDVPRSMQYKITDYNQKSRLVTSTEKLFSLQNFRQRGPEALAAEFRQVQDEKLRVNRNFYIVLQDALASGAKRSDLIKIMKDRGISSKNAFRLLRGQNIPYTGYDGRMKSRVKDAQKFAKERGEIANRSYFYPKLEFKKIVREYKNKKLEEPVVKNDPLKEEIEAPKEPNVLERGIDRVKDLFSEAPIQTPPLGNTPTPIVQTAKVNVDPNTNLTRTQTALLSPEEQVIASRRT
jgi:hypothetical protein